MLPSFLSLNVKFDTKHTTNIRKRNKCVSVLCDSALFNKRIGGGNGTCSLCGLKIFLACICWLTIIFFTVEDVPETAFKVHYYEIGRSHVSPIFEERGDLKQMSAPTNRRHQQEVQPNGQTLTQTSAVAFYTLKNNLLPKSLLPKSFNQSSLNGIIYFQNMRCTRNQMLQEE